MMAAPVATVRAVVTNCSTSSTVMPWAASVPTNSYSSDTINGASPIESSSSSRTSGSVTRAREMASICCSPPERVPAICRRRSFSRGNVA